MRKKVGFKFASISVSSPDGNDLAPKLKKLVWSYFDEMRCHGSSDPADLVVFMLYCSYISRNSDSLGLDGFDSNYSIDEVKGKLGNKYVASEFVAYYAGLCTQKANLPDLRDIEIRSYDLSEAITSWSSALDASGLSLMEDSDYETASAIQHVLAETLSSDAWGGNSGESSTPLSIAELATMLADVDGKSVLDFACGNGIYLATALARGASCATGRDVNIRAVMQAKILCFFANPLVSHDIAPANVLTAVSATSPAQRVFVAPPLGMRLREFDIQEKGYYTDVLTSVMGENAMGVSSMEDFCIAKAFSSLTDDGVAVLHVSASFLFHQQKSRQSLRRALVEGSYLQTVIELPSGCIPGAGVKSALLVISKRPVKEGVLIVDFDSREIFDKGYVAKSRGHCDITNAGIDWLAKTVRRRDEIPLVSTVVDREEILGSGSNLCYSAYGDVFDYESILAETRSAEDIMSDMKTAQLAIGSLSKQIADILISIKKKG